MDYKLLDEFLDDFNINSIGRADVEKWFYFKLTNKEISDAVDRGLKDFRELLKPFRQKVLDEFVEKIGKLGYHVNGRLTGLTGATVTFYDRLGKYIEKSINIEVVGEDDLINKFRYNFKGQDHEFKIILTC